MKNCYILYNLEIIGDDKKKTSNKEDANFNNNDINFSVSCTSCQIL